MVFLHGARCSVPVAWCPLHGAYSRARLHPCRYIFTGSEDPLLGHSTNNTAFGHSILLDPREPPDNGDHDTWRLRYLPVVVMVRPANTAVPELGYDVPHDCIPVEPRQSSKSCVVAGISMKRENVCLGSGYAVTDYYAQGLTFHERPWIVDLAIPPTGQFPRAGIVVVTSRYRDSDDVHVLRPLWPPGNALARERVVARYHSAMQMSDHLAAELERLRLLHEATQIRLARLCLSICLSVPICVCACLCLSVTYSRCFSSHRTTPYPRDPCPASVTRQAADAALDMTRPAPRTAASRRVQVQAGSTTPPTVP